MQRVDVESTIDFAQKSKLDTQTKIKRDIGEMMDEVRSLQGLICKCHSRVLIQEYEEAQRAREEMMVIDGGSGDQRNTQQVRFDNMYEVLFNGSGLAKSKESLNKKVVISTDRLDFLDNGSQPGSNVAFVETLNGRKAFEVEKVKISKTFKLVNPEPKFQSVPATPQFIDLAGAHLTYPSLEEPLSKYKSTGAAGGLFKKLTGFFGRS